MSLAPVHLSEWSKWHGLCCRRHGSTRVIARLGKKTMSRNLDLLQKSCNKREVIRNELDPKSIPEAAAVAPQVPLRLGGIDLGLTDSPTPSRNALPQTGQRSQVPIQPNPQGAGIGDRSLAREFCHECGMLVPKTCLFCPQCGAFEGSIAEEDSDGSIPKLPQRNSFWPGRLTGWLQVLRRRATPDRILVGAATLTLLAALAFVVVK
jgi:hypothetical protein